MPPPKIGHLPGSPITKPRRSDEDKAAPLKELDRDEVFNDEAGSGIRIAVLDTWPDTGDQTQLRATVAKKGHNLGSLIASNPAFTAGDVSNALTRFFRAAGNDLVHKDRIYTDYYDRYATPGDPRCASLFCDGAVEEPRPMPDHGLFVADLIKEVAPGATLSVYRVLNDWGMGDLRTVAYAMAHAIREAAGRPLIINLSLGFAPPLAMIQEFLASPEFPINDSLAWVRRGKDLVRQGSRPRGPLQWGPGNQKNPASGTAAFGTAWSKGVLAPDQNGNVRLVEAMEALDHLFRAEHLPPNVLVVAAAGNDSCKDWVAHPRIPALVEGVLGVSSAIPDAGNPGQWRQTDYSNADDLAKPDDGIAAFGGEVDPTKVVGGSTNAPIALYMSDDLPGGNGEGLAQWSGTSFATPLASAYAAAIWAATPNANAETVLEAVLKNPDGSERRAIPLGH